jgi:hypothetical protein
LYVFGAKEIQFRSYLAYVGTPSLGRLLRVIEYIVLMSEDRPSTALPRTRSISPIASSFPIHGTAPFQDCEILLKSVFPSIGYKSSYGTSSTCCYDRAVVCEADRVSVLFTTILKIEISGALKILRDPYQSKSEI